VKLRALLICEDVRLEVDGSLTLIGVRNDRLRVRVSETDPIVLESLAVLAVIGGLSGFDRVGYRGYIRHVDEPPSDRPLSYEDHAPVTDEHNFIFVYTPMTFPRLGTYEVVIDLEVAMETVTYRHRFRIENAPD
jgi:hypothetical protein